MILSFTALRTFNFNLILILSYDLHIMDCPFQDFLREYVGAFSSPRAFYISISLSRFTVIIMYAK